MKWQAVSVVASSPQRPAREEAAPFVATLDGIANSLRKDPEPELVKAVQERLELMAQLVITPSAALEPIAVKLAVVTDEITDAAVLLRRPTGTNREGVTVLITQLRQMLETIEREAWPNRPPQ